MTPSVAFNASVAPVERSAAGVPATRGGVGASPSTARARRPSGKSIGLCTGLDSYAWEVDMAGKGPAPKLPDQRRRRNATPGFKRLSHEGRFGDPPASPLTTPSAAELNQWRELWSLPQAVEWERIRCEPMVALYVRVFVSVTTELDPKMLNELRQLDAKIGLSPRSMLDLRWEIDEAIVETEPGTESNGHRVFVPDGLHHPSAPNGVPTPPYVRPK